MRKIRTIIADDEKAARSRLRALLAAERDIEIIAETENGTKTIDDIGRLQPDLLFLDFQMPPPTGLDVLRAVQDQHLPCTIFVTAHAEHAVEAFAVHALDYLLKPFTPARLRQAVERARRQIELLNGRPDERLLALLQAANSGGFASRYLVRNNERYSIVLVDEVEYFESAANYIVAHSATGKHILRKSMTELEEELDPQRFFRVSRGAVVQFRFVVELQTIAAGQYVVMLRSGARVPMTRQLREFQERLAVAR